MRALFPHQTFVSSRVLASTLALVVTALTPPVVAGISVAGVAGCGGGKQSQPGAQSPERQSEAEYDLAREYFYKGEPRQALDHAQKAVELDDANAKALYFTSTIYLWFCSADAGFKSPDCRLPDAEKHARLALKADETFRDARNLLGQILILEKKFPEAILVLEPLTKDPAYGANYLAWGNLGWAQVLSGDVNSGIASLKNSITQPRFCVGHYRLGIAYEKKGDLGQAESSLTNAVTVESPECQNLQDAWEARARVRMKLGRVDDARADFTKCRDISAASPTGKTCVQMLAQKQ
jgi:type IV pilus assembly protein PilF